MLLALPLFVACTENNEEPKPEPNEVMNFKAEGGQGTIEYTLVNAREDVEFEAVCEAAWIGEFAFGEDITFTVAENDAEDDK